MLSYCFLWSGKPKSLFYIQPDFASSPCSSSTLHFGQLRDDERIGATFVLYPKPFGIFAEYNVGRGPEFDKILDSITTQSLHGGFITASYKLNLGEHTLIPFVRYQTYKGGKKHELDARS
jgi:hypothetical protein